MATYLECAIEEAALCTAKFSAAEFDYGAGLSHARGKFSPDLQTYLISPKSRREPDHSTQCRII